MTPENIDLTPENLLSHAHPMILIDAVESYGEDFAVALVTPAIGKPFADSEGNVPAWVGMEYMAQSIGIYAGIRAQLEGQPVRVGFLLGTRSYEVETEQFCSGLTYAVQVQKIFEDGSLSAFECTIYRHQRIHRAQNDGQDHAEPCLARAVINTFQPDNIDEFMEGTSR
ncbi:hypothetical protein [Endozoicomonas sp.]|uniref:ApeP family dehydratase n=1 Tax=Endozoicomonas sp. TaxID=1892382 RepID=UPI0028867AA6|nr:hypothetical protein [Endozoicomonas sp.]